MIFVVLLLALFPQQIGSEDLNEIIFWNIGQGQWITVVQPNKCLHFDVGGEFFSPQKLSEVCAKKQNRIFLSHWDWDHIGLINQLKYSTSDVCIEIKPLGKAKQYKVDFIKRISPCETISRQVDEISFPKNSKADNDLSQVFVYDQKLLIPGDSTRKMEKIWANQLSGIKLKWLSVSHHGSRTSTSKEFLEHVNVQQAVVSARKAVYGHPHKQVLVRLKQNRIPVIKTEDWGNIRVISLSEQNFQK